MREGTVWGEKLMGHFMAEEEENTTAAEWQYNPLTEEKLNLWYKSPSRQQQSLCQKVRRWCDEVMTQSYSVHLFSLMTFQSQIKGTWEGAAGLALTIPLCWGVTVNRPKREPLVLDEESKGSQLGWKSLTNRQTQVFLNIDLFLNILRKRDWNKKQIKKNGNREREKNWKSCTETICTGLN